jgi:TRAP-type C4-dicarboxylate transport system permease large subunit
MVVYREITFKSLFPLLVNAAMTTSVVMYLVAAALVTSYMITLADLPQELIEMLGPLVDSPTLLMFCLVILLTLVGTAMDLTPTILILAPVLMPIFIMVGCTGLLTPPVGTVLNVVCGVARIRMEDIIKGVWPYVLAYTALIVLLVIFPEIVLAPLRWFY